jgi:hypothetical protein
VGNDYVVLFADSLLQGVRVGSRKGSESFVEFTDCLCRELAPHMQCIVFVPILCYSRLQTSGCRHPLCVYSLCYTRIYIVGS